MPRSKHKSKSKGKNNTSKNINPSASAIIYRGPYKLKNEAQQVHTDTLILRSVIVFASSAGGVINQVIDSNPSGYLDWSSVAALWDEYRALSVMIHFQPYDPYLTTKSVRPLYILTDRDSAGALSSVNAAVQFESCKSVSLIKPWSHGIKMNGIEEADFVTTASPAASFWFKSYQTGLTVSTNYGEAIITILIQVRGRN